MVHTGDIFEPVGSVVGSLKNCKVGDGVVEITMGGDPIGKPCVGGSLGPIWGARGGGGRPTLWRPEAD